MLTLPHIAHHKEDLAGCETAYRERISNTSISTGTLHNRPDRGRIAGRGRELEFYVGRDGKRKITTANGAPSSTIVNLDPTWRSVPRCQ